MDYYDAEVGDTVFVRYMGVPGTVLQVVTVGEAPIGYVVDVWDYDTNVFRTDEVDEFDREKWEE